MAYNIDETLAVGDPLHVEHHKALATAVNNLDLRVDGKAASASPVFTGNPTAPTPAPGDSDLSLANTAFVQAAINSLGLSTFARFVIVTTGSETRPSGTFVIWLDMREGEVSAPSAMGASDVRFRPGTLGPVPVAPTVTTTTLDALTQGTGYSRQLTATGTTPFTWTVTAGTLPAGLTLSSGGLLSGTPTTSGAYSFTVTATNSAGNDAQLFTGTISATGSGGSEHSIFGSAAPAGPHTTHTDGGEGSWTASQFYITASPARTWYVKGARYYVPPGSVSIGQTAYAGLMRRAAADGSVYLSTANISDNTLQSNGYRTAFESPLVAGWNEVRFASALPMNSLDGIIIGIQVTGGQYTVTNGPGNSAIQSVDGVNLYLAEVGDADGEALRSWYAGTATATLARIRTTRHYGQDIIVSETA